MDHPFLVMMDEKAKGDSSVPSTPTKSKMDE
jgi:hypothetical protein